MSHSKHQKPLTPCSINKEANSKSKSFTIQEHKQVVDKFEDKVIFFYYF